MAIKEIKGYSLSVSDVGIAGNSVYIPTVDIDLGNNASITVGSIMSTHRELTYVKAGAPTGYSYGFRSAKAKKLPLLTAVQKVEMTKIEYLKNDELEAFLKLNVMREYGKEFSVIHGCASNLVYLDGSTERVPINFFVPTALVTSSDLFFEGKRAEEAKIIELLMFENTHHIAFNVDGKTILNPIERYAAYLALNYDLSKGIALNSRIGDDFTAEGLLNLLSRKAKDKLSINPKEVHISKKDTYVIVDEDGKTQQYKILKSEAVLMKYLFDIPGFVDDYEPPKGKPKSRKSKASDDDDKEEKPDKPTSVN